MGNESGTTTTVDGDLTSLLGPWEDRRLRRHREHTGGREVLAGAARWCDAPPGTVRQAFEVLAGLTSRSVAEVLGDTVDGQPPQAALLDLAEAHWGRISGAVDPAVPFLHIDALSVPTAKAAALQSALATSWPDALVRAKVSAWASWCGPLALAEVGGDRFADLDLQGASVVTWWWD